MAISIEIIEIIDIPMAVLNARRKTIWRDKMKVSSMIEVIKPLMMARIIMPVTGKAISVI
jgi:biotin synthase-like enzyme